MYRIEPTIMAAVIKLQRITVTTPFYKSKVTYYCLKGLIICGLFYNLVPELTFFKTHLHNIRVCTSVIPTLCQLLATIFKIFYISIRINAHFKLLQVYELTVRKRRSLYSERFYVAAEMEITKLTKWFTISIFFYIAVYIIPPLAYQIYLFFVDSAPHHTYLLPFKHIYFFTITSVPQYLVTVTIGIISITLMGLSYLSVDLTLFAYCLYTRALFKDLQTMFELDMTGKDNLPQIKNAINFHNDIFRMINRLNDCFAPIIVAQFLNSSLIICTVIFQSTLDDTGRTDKIKNVSFVFGAICQILFYSIFGTMITDESFNIANFAYACKWTHEPLQNKKAIKQYILLVVRRSQKEVGLDGFKMFKCNMEAFVSIMDVSFSTLAVLQSMSP